MKTCTLDNESQQTPLINGMQRQSVSFQPNVSNKMLDASPRGCFWVKGVVCGAGGRGLPPPTAKWSNGEARQTTNHTHARPSGNR